MHGQYHCRAMDVKTGDFEQTKEILNINDWA